MELNENERKERGTSKPISKRDVMVQALKQECRVLNYSNKYKVYQENTHTHTHW